MLTSHSIVKVIKGEVEKTGLCWNIGGKKLLGVSVLAIPEIVLKSV
jgi:hypothetical protein